jgi:hypothetical protein
VLAHLGSLAAVIKKPLVEDGEQRVEDGAVGLEDLVNERNLAAAAAAAAAAGGRASRQRVYNRLECEPNSRCCCLGHTYASKH